MGEQELLQRKELLLKKKTLLEQRDKLSAPEDPRLKSTSMNSILSAGIDARTKQAETDIAERGNVWGNIKKDVTSGNAGRVARGILGGVVAPTTQIESAVANPALALQKGEVNPYKLGIESGLGLTGRKQGQYGDVMRIAGYEPWGAAAMGGVLNLAPAKVALMAKKTFGAITKIGDKGITRAGDELLKGADAAASYTGEAVTRAYKPIESALVNVNDYTRTMKLAPKALSDEIKEQLGDELASGKLTIGLIRKVKQIVGKYRPSSLGRGEKGLAEDIKSDKIEDLYTGLKSILTNETIKKVGKDYAEKLLVLENSASEVFDAASYIRRTIVDPTIKKATKAGKMAEKLTIAGDTTGRVALSTIKSSGKEAMKAINSAMSALESFNRWKVVGRIGEHALGAGVFGGVAGSLGGMALGKVMGRNK